MFATNMLGILTEFITSDSGQVVAMQALPGAWVVGVLSAVAVVFGTRDAEATMTCSEFCNTENCCQGSWQNGNTCYACCYNDLETPTCGQGTGCNCV